MQLRIGIVAGEASGDILGAGLLKALKARFSNVIIEGIGGEKMQAQGCRSLFSLERLSVMGFIEPLKRLPELIHMRRSLYQHFKRNPPDIFIGVDSPAFNLGLEKKIKALGVPTVHYVSPSVWAWRQGRIHKIKKAVDLMLTLLPFEAAFYKKHGVKHVFVGHPLADEIPLESDSRTAKEALALPLDQRFVALLPGSRGSEIQFTGETLVQAAALCHQQENSFRIIIPTVCAAHTKTMKALCAKHAPDVPVTFAQGQSRTAMAAADVVMLTSGTATLEAMLVGRPMVVAFKMSALTYAIAKRLVKTPYIALPNIIMQKLYVPEFIQSAATPEAIAEKVLMYYRDGDLRHGVQVAFRQWHEELCLHASEQAAKAVESLISSRARHFVT